MVLRPPHPLLPGLRASPHGDPFAGRQDLPHSIPTPGTARTSCPEPWLATTSPRSQADRKIRVSVVRKVVQLPRIPAGTQRTPCPSSPTGRPFAQERLTSRKGYNQYKRKEYNEKPPRAKARPRRLRK